MCVVVSGYDLFVASIAVDVATCCIIVRVGVVGIGCGDVVVDMSVTSVYATYNADCIDGVWCVVGAYAVWVVVYGVVDVAVDISTGVIYHAAVV